MEKNYKVTVIGAGDRGNTYMNMLQRFYKDEIVWDTVCDILPDRLEKAYTQFGFRNKTDKWETAIMDSRPDIVIVATPAFYHCDIAMFAMRCGCHVLTEKPLDLSLAKCVALDECQKQTGKVLGVGMQYRNTSGFRPIKHAIDRGLFGNNMMIQYIDIRETRPKIAMHDAARGNGGPMVDMACHLFDLMRWYYQCDPVRVSAQWRVNAINRSSLASIQTKAPDSCFMTIEYENGSLGNIMMNWGLPKSVNGGLFSTITGSEGLINTYKVQGQQTADVITEGGEIVSVGVNPEDADDLIHAERAVFKHFVEEIEGRGKAQCSIHEGMLTLATSMAAIRSSALGRPVTLKEIFEIRPTIAECMTAKE